MGVSDVFVFCVCCFLYCDACFLVVLCGVVCIGCVFGLVLWGAVWMFCAVVCFCCALLLFAVWRAWCVGFVVM